MKKVFLTVIATALIAVSASAQLFVGGSFNFDTQSGTSKSGSVSTDKTSRTTFGISPMVGFYLNDQMAVGAEVSFSHTGTNNNQSPETTGSYNDFGIAPFIRYHVVEIGNVSLFGQASIGLSFGSSSSKSNGVSADGPSSTTFALGVAPGIAYKLGDKISVEAFLGKLAFRTESSKQTIGNTENKDTDNYFNFDLSSGLNLGFTYSF